MTNLESRLVARVLELQGQRVLVDFVYGGPTFDGYVELHPFPLAGAQLITLRKYRGRNRFSGGRLVDVLSIRLAS